MEWSRSIMQHKMEIVKWRTVPQTLERCRCKVSGALQGWGEKLNANEKWNNQWLSSLLAGSRSKKQVLEYHQVVWWQGHMIEILPIYIYNKHYCKEQKCEDRIYKSGKGRMTVFVYHVDSTNFNFYLRKCYLLHLNTGISDVIGDFF